MVNSKLVLPVYLETIQKNRKTADNQTSPNPHTGKRISPKNFAKLENVNNFNKISLKTKQSFLTCDSPPEPP